MLKHITRIFCLFVLILITGSFIPGELMAQAAPDEPVQMATELRSSGKIYVVVAVLVTILLGLFAYLISLDKKISRLEKK